MSKYSCGLILKDSIPISPPKGTPPPPVGQLLEDVQMAEQASPTTPVNGIATNGVLPKTELTDVEMSAPPPTTNGIHAHATPDTQDSVASPQDTSKPQSTLPSSVSEPSSSAKDTPEVTVASNSLPNNLTRDAPSMDADDDSQPPTKRARRLSDADRASLDHVSLACYLSGALGVLTRSQRPSMVIRALQLQSLRLQLLPHRHLTLRGHPSLRISIALASMRSELSRR